MKRSEVGSPFQRSIAFKAGDYIERHRNPSPKQLPHMLKAWELAEKKGFDTNASGLSE